MSKPSQSITPANRVERWRKLWGSPRKLGSPETDAAFEEFQENLVPGHMHKMFLKLFGTPKAQFGNRFFVDGAAFHGWDTRISSLLLGDDTHVEATVIYGSPEALEAHAFRGERRRTLRDVVIDDWHAACAIVRSSRQTLYIFIEPKMRGCIVYSTVNEAA